MKPGEQSKCCKCPDDLENVQRIATCLNDLEGVEMIKKVSGSSGKTIDDMENTWMINMRVQIIWKVSG